MTLDYSAREKPLPQTDALRQCTKCLQEKPLTAFYQDQSRSDGYAKQCKECKCSKVKEYCQDNPEKRRQDKLAWKKTEKGKECDKRYYDNNRDAINKRLCQRRASDPEGVKHKMHHWRIKNPEKAQAIIERGNKKRQERLSQAFINDFTNAQWKELLELFAYRCAYCHRTCNRLERDHVMPLMLGGNHTKSNIVPACRSCNAKKQDRDLSITQAFLIECLKEYKQIDIEELISNLQGQTHLLM
jgi:hypothetical protein